METFKEQTPTVQEINPEKEVNFEINDSELLFGRLNNEKIRNQIIDFLKNPEARLPPICKSS